MQTYPKHIAIAGNIGSGKTTLAEKLAKHYGWSPLYESVDQNPYLKDFYGDMPKWAFHLQIYFLHSRFTQANKIKASDRTIIQDRTIYEDAYIFATNLRASGHLSEKDYATYLNLFHAMLDYVKPPNLLIYLRADLPKLVEQIQKRNRDFENSIQLEYLKNLNEQYEKWIGNYKQGKLLIIDVNHLDFVNKIEDFAHIVGKIEMELNSLFS